MKLYYIAPVQICSVAESMYYSQQLRAFSDGLYKVGVPVMVIISILNVLITVVKYKTGKATKRELMITLRNNAFGLAILFALPIFTQIVDGLLH